MGLAPLSLLVSLVVLTGAAWVLTLYHTLSMSMPMGIAVRGGMAAEGLGGMRHAPQRDRLLRYLAISYPHPADDSRRPARC
jgi:predicted metal-binding membrane protein